MTKQEEFNHIKRIIEHPDNTHKHLKAVRSMIDVFEDKHGVCGLSINLTKLQTELIKKVKKDGRK